MDGKELMLAQLSQVFSAWEALLGNLTPEQITDPALADNWSIKDVVAHLWSWQQASVARMQAALEDKEPMYPAWWVKFGPDPEENLDRVNAWLYDACHNKAWPEVYASWKTQFQHYMELIRQVAEEDLLELGRYAWMGKYALAASTMGSLEHHEEHLENLRRWLEEHDRHEQ